MSSSRGKGKAHLTKEEFAARAEELRVPLYRVACAYLRREQDRLDAVQEALLHAWEARHKLRQEAYFKSWLTRIMIRECVNILRQQKRVFPAESLPEPASAEPSGNPALRDAILALPRDLRIVIVLFYMEGYSTEEISRILRTPKGTVCSRLSRARKMLKDTLREEADL